MKKQLLALLLTSLVFTAGCSEAAQGADNTLEASSEAQSSDNTFEASSEAESSMAETVTDIPKVEYDYDIYERFTTKEITNMDFSRKAVLSLTTDYDDTLQEPLAVGDIFKVEAKLSNMTNQTLTIHAFPPPEVTLYSKANINPAACGNDDEFTLEPYEIKSYFLEVEITDDLTQYELTSIDSYYHFSITTLIEIYAPDIIKLVPDSTDMIDLVFVMKITDLKIPIKKD